MSFASTDAQRFRVCRAATEVFTQHQGGPTVSERAVDNDTVRLDFGANSAPGAQIAECDFTGERVAWRTLDGAAPAGFSPETAAYALDGRTVRLRTTDADGATSETVWFNEEFGRSVNVEFSAGTE